MEMTEITRTTLTPSQWDDSCLSLAADAKQVLGYDVLTDHQSEDKLKLGVLGSALAKLGIDVLDFAQVKRYQLEIKQETEKRMHEEWLSNDPQGWGFYGCDWFARPIKEYTQPIPEFALNKAVQIKREVPEAEILVDELREVKDPFLLVKLGKEQYYVEVWAEPKFEGRMR